MGNIAVAVAGLQKLGIVPVPRMLNYLETWTKMG